MINRDKFGNEIYRKVFERLLIKGQILSINGYTESHDKPNMFYKKLPEGILFADMRGTDMVPIWEDMSPLFYWKFGEDVPMWKRRRIIEHEFGQLSKDGCECRLSEEGDGDTTEEFTTSTTIEGGTIRWLVGGDGYCIQCGKDMQSDASFCSKECADACEEALKVQCPLCGGRFEPEQIVKHHTSYDPEITIQICRGCHNTIHKSDKLLHLKPEEAPGRKKSSS